MSLGCSSLTFRSIICSRGDEFAFLPQNSRHLRRHRRRRCRRRRKFRLRSTSFSWFSFLPSFVLQTFSRAFSPLLHRVSTRTFRCSLARTLRSCRQCFLPYEAVVRVQANSFPPRRERLGATCVFVLRRDIDFRIYLLRVRTHLYRNSKTR